MQITAPVTGHNVVYGHFNQQHQLIYIGSGNFKRAFDFQKRTPLWFEKINGPIVTVHILFESFDLKKVREVERRLIITFRPPANVMHVTEWHKTDPRFRLRQYTAVKCVDTGEVYENLSHAAKKTGISQSALSNCVNERPGYETVRGLKFVRCNMKGQHIRYNPDRKGTYLVVPED